MFLNVFYVTFSFFTARTGIKACLSENGQIYFLLIKMNGNAYSSTIKNNFLPIIDRPLFRALYNLFHYSRANRSIPKNVDQFIS
jgi:hypothetical protein